MTNDEVSSLGLHLVSPPTDPLSAFFLLLLENAILAPKVQLQPLLKCGLSVLIEIRVKAFFQSPYNVHLISEKLLSKCFYCCKILKFSKKKNGPSLADRRWIRFKSRANFLSGKREMR